MGSDDLPEGVNPETVEVAMLRILEAEEEKLHMDLPRNIINEIEQIIKDEVN
jgi:hypothetical protein